MAQADAAAVNEPSVFIGVDMVDGCRKPPRKVDVAIMDRSRVCRFEQWDFNYAGNGLFPDQLAPPGYVLAIDGPQGLAASRDRGMRECERAGGVAGKSSYDLPKLSSAPFAGFVISSVRLFASLWLSGQFHLHGLTPNRAHEATLIEVYPGRAWTVLAKQMSFRRLSKKTLVAGRDQRRELLESIGLTLTDASRFSHDQLDAALAAELALRFDEGRTTQQGESPFWDDSARVLREGFIVYP